MENISATIKEYKEERGLLVRRHSSSVTTHTAIEHSKAHHTSCIAATIVQTFHQSFATALAILTLQYSTLSSCHHPTYMVVVLLNFLMKMRLYVVLSLFVCEHKRREENLN